VFAPYVEPRFGLEQADGLMAAMLARDPRLANRGFNADATKLSSPERLTKQLGRSGMSPDEVAERMAAEHFVYGSEAEGAARPYEGKDGDRVTSYQVAGEGEDPLIRVGTGDRTMTVVAPGTDPKIVSTDFFGCGATVIYGTDAEGRQVIFTGHVMHADPAGHKARLDEDLADMEGRGLTNLKVVVVPGNDPDLPEGARIPPDLAEQIGDRAQVNVIPRGGGEDDAAHIVVTRDGVGVLSGGIGEDVQAVAAFDLATGGVDRKKGRA
jgi:hypothetical protein